ncbi:hypothetical protein A2435_00730 [Candidatus Woesebacteria bacterium RIFOXYC1_FULL_46_16]|uniref:Uncharacterized protein n=5 Tax=Candidatus Woeseibacteriota TaxID=1752722 RepID=A0A0G1T2U3_9BACT|nr:MAG: hypothetical protein UX34_C0004G0021 [Candidatus Woesebacteria bacterium GW2011_GWF1_46_13]KKU48528.1 MAG: hypothetical protein UX67_C0013G0008 [Candidatus Woesebacteria bacterium GW2011_GWF2_46_8]OGM78508.1 MAG: hypothetical protein A2197_02205 [Candidatus Woesebacteria bacterium RIFOXYA1_FULL_48_16]OGM85128.1 MAG: hypothetical protein A2435_00730 [Candidatus Woesebacteria bacterium RIFOXYC1_FULL_46_16]OGM89074.1 MAG: hypothetical protein A2597_01700 [Candidatus Woesebacteria bacterium
MERKGRFKYPCLVDITKNCPVSCELHQKSVRLLIGTANGAGKTPEEELEILRSGTPEMIRVLNRRSLLDLFDSSLLDKCKRYSDGKIDTDFYGDLLSQP